MTNTAVDSTLENNAYAIAYRLMGDRPAARAVAGIAAERLRQRGGVEQPDWLYLLVGYTLDQAFEIDRSLPGQEPERLPAADDQFSGLRAALRRRLARATPDERVAGALVHLAGYPVDFAAGVLHHSPDETAALAGVLAPPPGVAYRDLGDPELTRVHTGPAASSRRLRRPHWTTVAAVAVVVAVVIAATQVTGPRPTLGPPVDEGGLAVSAPPEGGTDLVDGRRNVVDGAADPVNGMADRSPN